MYKRSKLTLAGLGAMLLMAFAVGTASARNFSVSNQNFRGTFANLEFAVSGFSTTTCRVTLEGSLHSRTIPKTVGTLLGYVTRVITGNCNNEVIILSETLPWHVRYMGFSGRLPNITLILVSVRAAFNVVGCLAAADIEARFSRRPSTGELDLVQIPAQTLSVIDDPFCIVTSAIFRSGSNGSVFLLGTTNRVTVTLI